MTSRLLATEKLVSGAKAAKIRVGMVIAYNRLIVGVPAPWAVLGSKGKWGRL
jgi:hypothetical protein